MHRTFKRQRGVSLIEVLVAVLIFSLGLVGLASLMVVASQSNHSAYLRTQAGFLASNMANRMRANPAGVWDSKYNSSATVQYPMTGTVPACDATDGCNPAQVAKRDQLMWSDMLTSFLPGAKATINCTTTNLVGTPPGTQQILERPPYGGSCLMRLTWNERGVGNATNARDASAKTFDWVFQP